MTSFSQHPLPDIRRTVQHRDAVCLTCVEKANGFDIHQIHLLQIQSYCSATLDLGPQLIQMVRSKRAAHPKPRSAHPSNPFKFQRHGLSESEAPSCQCNDRAILNSLKGCKLELPLVPNFGELPFAEENAGG